jgi:hypothetical protein
VKMLGDGVMARFGDFTTAATGARAMWSRDGAGVLWTAPRVTTGGVLSPSAVSPDGKYVTKMTWDWPWKFDVFDRTTGTPAGHFEGTNLTFLGEGLLRWEDPDRVVHIIDLAGRDQRRTVRIPIEVFYTAADPAGRWLAWAGVDDGLAGAHVVDLHSGAAFDLPLVPEATPTGGGLTEARGEMPSFSPDGKMLAVAGARAARRRVHRRLAAGARR